MQAIEEAVKGANLIYLTARGHVVVVSEAEYPVVQGAEAAGGAAETVLCELWERCWCVLEMVVRYLAEQQVPRQLLLYKRYSYSLPHKRASFIAGGSLPPSFIAGGSLCPVHCGTRSS